MMPRFFPRLIRRLNALRLTRPSFVNLGRYSVVINRDGRMIFTMSDDLSLTPRLAVYGEWEGRVVGVLRRLLRPGDLVVEGGANIGCHTLVIAEAIGPTGRLYAFEPLPDLLPLLEINLSHLNREYSAEVKVRNLALLDHEGPIEMLLDPLFLGSGHLGIPHASHRYSRRVSAQATTIDVALAEEGTRPVSLIRLDIEGSEILALRGAEETIRRSPALRIVMEWLPIMLRPRSDPMEGVAWLSSRGFRFWRIKSSAWRSHRLEPVPSEALPTLPHCEIVASRDDP
jgi:FkbM family methyltransferase